MSVFRSIVGAWRLFFAVILIVIGAVSVLIIFRKSPPARVQQVVQWWSRRFLLNLGIQIRSRGQPRAGGTLVVANHVSFLDIPAMHSVCPALRFVSKADVKHWPLMGDMARITGTLFIDRGSRKDALRVVHQMAQAMQDGDPVAFFPEGTTGNGLTLLNFHANLLQAAIVTETPIQPVTVRFSEPGHAFSPTVSFTGDTTLMESFWNIARMRGMEVHVEFLPPVGVRHADRRALSEELRQIIGRSLYGNDWPTPADTEATPQAI